MSTSVRRERLRAHWQAPVPAPSRLSGIESAAALPRGILYNEFDYHRFAYRHVDVAAHERLGLPPGALHADPIGAWASLLPVGLHLLFTDQLLPTLADALRSQRSPTHHYELHLSYPLGKMAPFRQVEHRIELHTAPDTRLPTSHREWIQPSLRDTSHQIIHAHLTARSASGTLRTVWQRSYQAPTVFDTALSPRERDVARHVIKGSTSAAIAEALFISVHTISSHRRTILLKTETNNTAELISLAAAVGWPND